MLDVLDAVFQVFAMIAEVLGFLLLTVAAIGVAGLLADSALSRQVVEEHDRAEFAGDQPASLHVARANGYRRDLGDAA